MVAIKHPGTNLGEIDNIQWRLDSQGLLHIHLVDAQNVNFGEDQAFWEAKPWQKTP
jgi:hypothetical protein